MAVLVSRPGSKQAAIIYHGGDEFAVLLCVGTNLAHTEEGIRESLGEALAQDLGLGGAMRLAARYRKYGPFIVYPQVLEEPTG